MKLSSLLNEAVIIPNLSVIKSILSKFVKKIAFKDKDNYDIKHEFDKDFRKYNISLEDSYGESQHSEHASVGIIGANVSEIGHISILFNHNLQDTFEDEDLTKKFVNVITNLIEHESIHKVQMSKVKNKNKLQILNKMAVNPSEIIKYLSSKV